MMGGNGAWGGVAWKECCIQGVYCIGVCGMGVLHRGCGIKNVVWGAVLHGGLLQGGVVLHSGGVLLHGGKLLHNGGVATRG